MSLDTLLADIRACRACADELPHEPRPVVRVSKATRLLICGQAPGRRVHESGLPFDDPSGNRLRDWLGVDRATFYASPVFGVAPMAYCFPGTDANGADFPPPPRCAALWRKPLLAALPGVRFSLLVGSYAQKWALGDKARSSMTDTVAAWRDYLPFGYLPTPHPSWRNTGWLRRNPWFDDEVVPFIRQTVAGMLGQ